MNVTKNEFVSQLEHENNYSPFFRLFYNEFYLPFLAFHNFQLLHLI